jgi:hypothetical protein
VQADSITAALHAIRLEHGLAIAAIAASVVIPFLGLWWLHATAQRNRAPAAKVTRSVGCLGFVALAGAAFLFGVCGGGEIGVPGKVRLIRALSAPVIAALDRYHRTTGHYPNTLTELVPRYVTSAELHAPEASLLGYPFAYQADRGTYELTASYAGPGMNTCRCRPRSSWQCGGYF